MPQERETEQNSNESRAEKSPVETAQSKFGDMVASAKEKARRDEGLSRRGFLKVSAAATVSAEIPHSEQLQPDREDLEVRIRMLEQKEQHIKQYFGANYPGYLGELKQASQNRPFLERWGLRKTNPDVFFNQLRKNPESVLSKMPKVYEVIGTDGKLSEAQVAEILEKTYPKGWVKNEIAAVVQTKEKSDGITTRRGFTWDLKKLGVETNQKMVELGGSDEPTSAIINEVLSHELAHANDWERDSDLSPEDKIQLLHAITQRLEKGDDFNNLQPKIIKNWLSAGNPGKGSPLENGRWTIAQEYWAEICRQYFDDPSKLHPEDLKIVDDHVRRTDPNFDPIQAKRTRDALLKSN